MHALEGLQVYYNRSKEDDIYHNVVGIILKNIHKIRECTIYDLAEMCYVSPTTISRLSRKLGYNGFQDFKNNLVNTVRNYGTLNQYMSFNERAKYEDSLDAYLCLMEKQLQNLKQELDPAMLDKIIDTIQECEQIHFYTSGPIFAEYRFQGDLIMAGHACAIKNSAPEQLKDIPNLSSRDMVIMLSPVVPDAVDVNEIVQRIKQQGAKLFILTDAHYPQFRKYADYIYCFEGNMGMIDDYRFAMYLNLLAIRFRERVLL